MSIDCTLISDLHGYMPSDLPGGDLLIICGDLTARDKQSEYLFFRDWLRNQDYKKKIFICGNHDGCIEKGLFYFNEEWMGAEYLCDSGTEFEGLKIYGTPWTKTFPGMNPHCKAFTCETEDELAEKFSHIPADIDILITHSPPFSILDECDNANVGSTSLLNVLNRINVKYLIFGHIHEKGGEQIVYKKPGFGDENNIICINASYVNERYQPVNNPIRIIL